jgi:proteasome lid subunit RPN8/RPN11
MIARLLLPQSLRDAIAADARAAFPCECCGLIEGRRENDVVRALVVHPVRNLAHDPDRFELDPAEQFRLMRILRGTSREIVGCYHSHPNGRAELSLRDRANAGEDDFVWLIVGIDADGPASWSCHVSLGGGWCMVEIAICEEHASCT